MATGRTGYTAPVNSGTFQPPADMADIYKWFDDRIDLSVATAASLPSTGNWSGRQAVALDTGVLWYWDTAWKTPQMPQIWVDRANVAVTAGGGAWSSLATSAWMTESKNVGFATWNGTIVAPLTGRYRLDSGVYGNNSAILAVTKNNTTPGQTSSVLLATSAVVGGEAVTQGSKKITLNGGDVLRMNIFPTGSFTWDTDPSSGWFGLEYIGG